MKEVLHLKFTSSVGQQTVLRTFPMRASELCTVDSISWDLVCKAQVEVLVNPLACFNSLLYISSFLSFL